MNKLPTYAVTQSGNRIFTSSSAKSIDEAGQELQRIGWQVIAKENGGIWEISADQKSWLISVKLN